MGEIEPSIKTEPAGRRGRGRRLLLAAAAVLALAVSLIVSPTPAEAQNTVTLVSNLALGAETTVLAGGSNSQIRILLHHRFRRRRLRTGFSHPSADFRWWFRNAGRRRPPRQQRSSRPEAVRPRPTGNDGLRRRRRRMDPGPQTALQPPGNHRAGTGRVGPRHRADPNNRAPY